MKNPAKVGTWERVNQVRKQRRIQAITTFGLVALGPILAIITYIGLGPAELDPSSSGIRLILLADLVYVLVIAALVLQRIARMISARRARSAGSQLHLRLTGVFALVALVPTVLVAVFCGRDPEFWLGGVVLGPGAQRGGHVAVGG